MRTYVHVKMSACEKYLPAYIVVYFDSIYTYFGLKKMVCKFDLPAHFFRSMRFLGLVVVLSSAEGRPGGHMSLPCSSSAHHTPTPTSPPVTITPLSGSDATHSPVYVCVWS